MRAVIIIGALFMLFYFKGRFATSWGLSINPNNILSEYVVNIIFFLPMTFKYILFYFLCLFLILGIFTKKKSIRLICWSLSFYIISMGLQVTYNLLSLHDVTILPFMQIAHPISIEAKYYYLLSQIDSIFRESKPYIYYGDSETLHKSLEQLTALIKGYTPDEIKKMNIIKLQQTAQTICNFESNSSTLRVSDYNIPFDNMREGRSILYKVAIAQLCMALLLAVWLLTDSDY